MVSASTVKRRSVARLAGRKRPSYYESDNDDFDRATDEEHPHRDDEARPSKRRSARQVEARERLTYQESDSEDELVEGGEDTFAQGLAPVQRQTRRRKTKPTTRSKARAQQSSRQSAARTKSQQKKQQPRARALGAPLKKRKNKDAPIMKKSGFSGPSDGIIPAWTSLPLEILRDIFIYASQPLHEATLPAAANAKWLLRVARAHRAFATPALEAYYQSPPLYSLIHPHYLLELLRLPQDKTYFNYRVKIKSLEADVVYGLSLTASGRSLFNLSDLVKETPLLQHLEVLHPLDRPPYRLMRPVRWSYPPELFDTLNATGIQLRTFRWSRHMVPSSMAPTLYQSMKDIHSSRAFEHLRSLKVCGFQVDNSSPSAQSEAPAEDSATTNNQQLDLAAAVSALPSLKDLTFISCDLIMETFLQRLPQNLERLELSNCLEVYGGMLQSYFATSGSQLRELELNHNAALNLSFLPSLQTHCPRLETLKMDCTYYSERHTFNDAFAMYDELLSVDSNPTWPSSLRRLELVQLQRLSPDAARNLFLSLLDSADHLPNLRTLVIQAHIDIPWRDRAGFRDQWIERLRRVFLRPSIQPNPDWGSLKQMRMWKLARKAETAQREPSPLVEISPARPLTLAAGHGGDGGEGGEGELFYASPAKTASAAAVEEPATLATTRPRRAERLAAVATVAREDRNQAVEKKGRGVSTAHSAVIDHKNDDSENTNDDDHQDSDSNDHSNDDTASDESQTSPSKSRKRKEKFIQGLCATVDIRIDNQRPREKQWTEREFIDSEASGDEDWVEGADAVDEDARYAW